MPLPQDSAPRGRSVICEASTAYDISDPLTCTAKATATPPESLLYAYFYACNTSSCNAPGAGPQPPPALQPSAAHARPAAAANAALVAGAAAALALW